jgi:hypothetical protein
MAWPAVTTHTLLLCISRAVSICCITSIMVVPTPLRYPIALMPQVEPCFLLNLSAIGKLHASEKITQDLIVAFTVVFMVRPAEKRA